MINFLDTSAILNGALYKYNNIYISPLVLTELEDIKNRDNKNNNNIKYLARKAVKEIIASKNINYTLYPHKKIEKMMKRYSFLTPINDHFLLCEANIFGEEKNEMVNFITSDGALYLFAQHLSHLNAIFFDANESQEENYCGWQDYTPTDLEMIELYSHPERNVLKAKTNQFLKIFEDGQIKDVLFWDGKIHRKLNYKEITSVLGEKIKPRNLEQKMYFDLLQNQNIPVKFCNGKFGTGKSYIALSYALDAVQKGRFDKIIFVKNNLEVKGAGTLGTLPGDEVAKQYPWLRQIEDHIGIQKFEEYLESGLIEPAHLSTLRGRDLKSCIVYVDEAENLLSSNIQLLIGRMAENSEIIFCADVKQCDYRDESNSGIPKMIACLQGHELFGMVKLIKTERSPVAAMADLMD